MQIKRGNTVIADVFLKNNSYISEEINGDFVAYIEFDVREPITVQGSVHNGLTINDYIEYEGNTYYIRYKESISKVETSLGYSYQVKLFHELYRMQDVAFFMYDMPQFQKHFNTFNGTAEQVLELIVKSMNRVSSGWAVGTVLYTKPKTFNFQNKMCSEVVNDVTEAYECEYWVEGKTLHFGKREFASGGLLLKQGSGFKNLSVKAIDENPPITRLFCYGGDTNINALKYENSYLMLPKLNPTDETHPTYIEKNTGKYGVIEAIVQFPEIFPKGTFGITERIANTNGVYTKFKSADIDFNILDYLIDGVDAIITFQDGALAGYDLTFNYESVNKIITVNKITEESALEVPGDINFDVGDRFILTGLEMPQEYINRAEKDLLEEAENYLNERCETRVQLSGECDEIYFAENDISIKCGQLVWVRDEKLGIDREIRCTSLKKFIENDNETPYRYEIVISDFLSANGFRQLVNEVKNIPNRIYNGINNLRNPNFFRNLQNSLAQYLGFFDFNEMVNFYLDGDTIIKGRYINTGLIDADAVVTKGLVAEMIAALDIVTERLTLTDGRTIVEPGRIVIKNDYKITGYDHNYQLVLSNNSPRHVNSMLIEQLEPENGFNSGGTGLVINIDGYNFGVTGIRIKVPIGSFHKAIDSTGFIKFSGLPINAEGLLESDMLYKDVNGFLKITQ